MLNRKIAVAAVTDKASAGRSMLVSTGASKDKPNAWTGKVCRNRVWSANQIDRLSITPTTAAVIAESNAGERLVAPQRLDVGRPDEDPEEAGRKGHPRRQQSPERSRRHRRETKPGADKADHGCCNDDQRKRRSEEEDRDERNGSQPYHDRIAQRAFADTNHSLNHDGQHGRLEAEEQRLDEAYIAVGSVDVAEPHDGENAGHDAVRGSHLDVQDWASPLTGQSVVVVCQKGKKLSEGTAAAIASDHRPGVIELLVGPLRVHEIRYLKASRSGSRARMPKIATSSNLPACT